MSLPENTSDICCHLKASPWPHTKFNSSRLANSQKVKDIQSFLSFANFYHHFIYRYSKITVSAHCVLPARVHPGISLMSAILPLKHFKRLSPQIWSLPIGYQTLNYSWDWCLWLRTHCCPFHHNSWWKFHTIAFHSWTFSALELNYHVHNKELLASNWHCLSELLPYQSLSSVDLSSWMLKGSIPTSSLNSERIPFPQNTSTISQTPSGTLDPNSLLHHLRCIYVLNSNQSPTMCSPILARSSPCRSFWSDKDPSSSP